MEGTRMMDIATVSEEAMGDRSVIDESVLDAVMAKIEDEGLQLLGPGGVLTELTSKIMNRALEAEMSQHLGYEKDDKDGWGSGNNRNGHSAKNVKTDAGEIPVAVPRDRNATFEPVVVPKHKRRLEGFNDLVCGLLARGMTTRDICSQLQETYGLEITPSQVSTISDAILPELEQWRQRALDSIYPILYLDAIVVKVRTDGRVINRPCYLALGINLGGEKHVLGMWLGDGGEGAKFWFSVCGELANRGLTDVLIVSCDGLNGFPEAIEATWPLATVQTCTVHLIRNSVRYCSYTDRRKVTTALKPIYRAATRQDAEDALDDFELEWGDRYPAIVNIWRRNWERFVPFLDFSPEIRKVIYTSNAIESMNYQLRKVTKTRGSFPTDDACYKMLFMAIDRIGHHRGGQLGTHTQGWRRALNAFTIAFPGRLEQHLEAN
jgi:putative transposase